MLHGEYQRGQGQVSAAVVCAASHMEARSAPAGVHGDTSSDGLTMQRTCSRSALYEPGRDCCPKLSMCALFQRFFLKLARP